MSNRSDSANEPTQSCDPSVGELDYLGLDSESRAIVQRCTFEIKTLTKHTSVGDANFNL